MAESRSFLGTGWSFPPTFRRESGGVDLVADEADIAESLRILLHTSLGERVMRPRYGANLRDHVFDPMDAATITFIEDLIRTAVIYHEPRIRVDGVTVSPDQAAGRLDVGVTYVVRSTNTRFNLVIPYYLPEESDVVPR
jgi:phage baseplate assembly protein W